MRAVSAFLLLCLLAASVNAAWWDTCDDCMDSLPCPARKSNTLSCSVSRHQVVERICDRIYTSLGSQEGLAPELRAPHVAEEVLSPRECQYIIQEAEKHAVKEGGWLTERHSAYPTTDFDTADIPTLAFPVANYTRTRIFPHFEKAFNLPPGILGINEVFIAKYSPEAQSFLDVHVDGSEFSFVVQLNDDYGCGGTLFVDERKRIRGKAGSAVVFCGRNRHMGLPVVSGTRYILAGFLNLGEQGICELHKPWFGY